MELEWKDIIILVQFIVIALLAFGAYKSVPPGLVTTILGYLEQKAKETPDKTDDAVVAEAKKLIEKLIPAATQPVTVNVSTPVESATG